MMASAVAVVAGAIGFVPMANGLKAMAPKQRAKTVVSGASRVRHGSRASRAVTVRKAAKASPALGQNLRFSVQTK
jgi:hypothetical protein